MFNSFIPAMVDRWFRTGEVVGPESPMRGGPVRARNGISPSIWFVDAQRGSDSNDGRNPQKPAKTLADLIGDGSSSRAKSGDTIFVVGNITEEITAYNLLEDITIIGAANRPRHADKARDFATYSTYTGISGCSWREAASHAASTPLLTIRGQGWCIENILFVPPSDAAALHLERNALSDVSEYDASHLSVKGCRFAGGQSGIEDTGGAFNVSLIDCVFHGSTNAVKSLTSAVDQATGWVIQGCVFRSNTNHLVVDAKEWTIVDNVFGKFTTQSIKLDQLGNAGSSNIISRNALSGTYSIAGGYKSNGAADEWGGNYNSLAGGITASDPA